LKDFVKSGMMKINVEGFSYNYFSYERGLITMTKEQYIRSNKVAYPLIMLSCGIVIMTLLGAITQGANLTSVIIQVVGIAIAMVIATVAFITRKDQKIGMIGVAFGGALMYFVVSFFNNNAYVFMYGFIVLFICMTYLNMRLIIWGNSFIVIGFIIHTLRMFMSNTLIAELVFLGGVTIVLCIFASVLSIRLLLKFNEENLAVIQDKAAAQDQASFLMRGVAEEITERFDNASAYLDDLKEAIAINDDAMKNISDSTESTAQAAQDQAEMCASIQAETDRAGHGIEAMMRSSEQVKENIEAGAEIISHLREQADTVTETNRSTTEAVTRLAVKVENVKNITQAILQISSQTNLLALNASIEAARAGEAGRGFAVVADEIRALSENTRESANKITAIIEELVSDVNETTQSMDISTNTIEQQTEMIDTTKNSFENIEREVTLLIHNIHETEGVMKEILRATGVINENISQLSASSEEVAATTEEGVNTSKNAVANLTRVTDELEQIVELSKKLQEV